MASRVDELREMGKSDLEERLLELRAGLSKEKALISSGTRAENPGKIKKMRRMIARILTVMREKETGKNGVKKGK